MNLYAGVKPSCIVHPRYLGIKPPTSKCLACKAIYEYTHPAIIKCIQPKEVKNGKR